MNNEELSRVFARIERLREEGKLPKLTQEDIDNEPAALAFTDFSKEMHIINKNDIIRAINFTVMNLDKLKEMAIEQTTTIGELYYKMKYLENNLNEIMFKEDKGN